MKIESRKIKNNLILLIPIFIIVFLIACTNTLLVFGGLTVYIFSLALIYLISFYTDKKLESKFNKISLSILIVAEIEKFKKLNKRLPYDEKEIELPKSRNGLYVKDFEYYIPKVKESEYIIKYFDGLWVTKVYVSSSNKWYIDD